MKQEIVVNDITFKIGDDVFIEEMKGEPIYKQKTGKILSIDDLGQIHGTWGGCALVPDIDKFRKIEK